MGKNNRVKPRIDKESLKLVLVLSVIALVSALILSVVYKFTVKTIDNEARLMAKFKTYYAADEYSALDTEMAKKRDYTQILNAYRASDGAVLILSKSEKAYNSAGISIIVIIKDDVILDVISYSSQETPGLGSKALQETHLSQYKGLNTSVFDNSPAYVSPDKDGDGYQIKYVTGATKSSTGVQYAVEAAVIYYEQL